MAYITKTEVKNYLGANFSDTLDSFVDSVIAGVQLWVEEYCGDERFGRRIFETPSPDSAETRNFDGNGDIKLKVGDLKELTSLSIDGIAQIVNEDYYLYPLNADKLGKPYQWIELIQPETRINSNSRIVASSPYVFEKAQRNVTLVGKWRYSDAVPADIKLAVLKLVGGVLKENLNDEDIREKKSLTLGDYKVDFTEVNKIAHALGVSDILNQYSREPKGKGSAASAGIAGFRTI